ncbi:conserved hypothetical protein [Tenacibaculum sp. 190524A02b]|uniref:Uncharacterized protein n=1 Tax=Tenacibaculum vairaonense TaxID=3137860 RepID=A0ABP1FA13_9FLAO
MVIFTGPDGANFCFTNNNKATNNKITAKNAKTVIRTVPPVLACNTIIIL